MGVDIYAILPEEIAVSVVAQMVAVRRSKPGAELPDRLQITKEVAKL
jgi:xanthine/CO dehydrogenase XdhC/CoxF family maturation factor